MKRITLFICLLICLLFTFPNLSGCDKKAEDEDESYLNEQGLGFYLLDNNTYGVKIGNATELSCITIPDKYCGKPVTIIMSQGFCQDTSHNNPLTKIIISSNVKKIERNAFYGHPNLNTVEFCNSSQLYYIDEGAFAYCRKLKSVELPDSLTYIGEKAFAGTAIQHIRIPKNVETIGSQAFCSDTKASLCAGILCESKQSGVEWDDDWDMIYYNIYEPEDALRGTPYFYRSDSDIVGETNYNGKFWKDYNKEEHIVGIWGREDNVWFIKNKYKIIDGERYSVVS